MLAKGKLGSSEPMQSRGPFDLERAKIYSTRYRVVNSKTQQSVVVILKQGTGDSFQFLVLFFGF
jgi:hypothetical protein